MIAHLVTANRETANSWIQNYIDTHHIPAQYCYTITPAEKELSIGQIRDLQREIGYRIPQGRLFIIEHFDTASEEAQNAMLKMLEQPHESDHFILLCPNEQAAIATIRSRVRVTRLQQPPSAATKSIAIEDLANWRSVQSEDDVRSYIDDAISYERSLAPTKWNTAHLRRLLSLRQMIQNHVTPQSIADSVTLLYR